MNHIYFAGYSAVHPADFVFEVPEGYDCYLLLITSTPARFRVNDQIVADPALHPTSPSSAISLLRAARFLYRIRHIVTA